MLSEIEAFSEIKKIAKISLVVDNLLIYLILIKKIINFLYNYC